MSMSFDQEECPHGMGDPQWCSMCKNGPKSDREVRAEVHRRYDFAATFPGRLSCGHRVEIGDTVVAVGNELEEKMVCERCAP